MRHQREPENPIGEPTVQTTRKSAKRNKDAVKNGTAKPNAHRVGNEPKPPKENFFNRLAQMTETDWDRYGVYVYRRWPRISKAGEPHYVRVHREAIDEEFIKTLYGSGRYLLKLNDQRRTVDEHPLEIMDLN